MLYETGLDLLVKLFTAAYNGAATVFCFHVTRDVTMSDEISCFDSQTNSTSVIPRREHGQISDSLCYVSFDNRCY